MKILYHLPSRSRPEKLIAAIENIITLAKHDKFVILVTLDIDDTACANIAFNKRLLSYEKVMPVYGFSDSKIHAVNRDIWMVDTWDIVFTHSDDMQWLKEGFDLDVLEAFEGFDGLVHFPDQKVGARTCTYPILSRLYYERDGFVYHPAFANVYADNFQHELAIKRGAYKFVDKKILFHAHPIWRCAPWDEMYRKNEAPENYDADRKVYERLKKEYDL